MKLYELSAALRAVGEQLLEAGGELTPELAQQLENLEGAFDKKVENVLLYAQELLREGEGIQAEAIRLQALADAQLSAAKRIREWVQLQMAAAGVTRVDGERLKVRIQRNGRPSIKWAEDAIDLPDAFRRTVYQLDGQAAYAYYQKHGVLPAGFVVELGSHLVVR